MCSLSAFLPSPFFQIVRPESYISALLLTLKFDEKGRGGRERERGEREKERAFSVAHKCPFYMKKNDNYQRTSFVSK